MPNIFREVRALRNDGKLHNRLIARTRILLGISAIILAIVAYNVFLRGAEWRAVPLCIVAGFLLGMFVFSRISFVQWNEEQEVVESGRMDFLGYVTLGLYIVFEIGLHSFLNDHFASSATVLLLSVISGVLAGRAIGTVVQIHRVYTESEAGQGA